MSPGGDRTGGRQSQNERPRGSVRGREERVRWARRTAQRTDGRPDGGGRERLEGRRSRSRCGRVAN